MPEVVATGAGDGVAACGYCHLPNGQGKPENASLAGQPYEYIVQQMTDWRNGLRKPGEPRMAPPSFLWSGSVWRRPMLRLGSRQPIFVDRLQDLGACGGDRHGATDTVLWLDPQGGRGR